MNPQPVDGHLAILVLAATFRGYRVQTAGLVNNLDGGFHLIAMLASRTTRSGSTNLALFQQRINRQTGGVHCDTDGLLSVIHCGIIHRLIHSLVEAWNGG